MQDVRNQQINILDLLLLIFSTMIGQIAIVYVLLLYVSLWAMTLNPIFNHW